jgi:hypothetical protein
MATTKEKEILIAVETNAETGETIERSLTTEEIKDLEAIQAQAKAEKAEQTAKAEARTSALAKLAALGLTEEEIAAL